VCSPIGDVADAGWRLRGGLALGSAGALGEAYSTLRVSAALSALLSATTSELRV